MQGSLAIFHQLGTVVFAVGSLFVASRLLWLHRKTFQKPELFLGVGIGASVLGYGVMVVGMAINGNDLTAPPTTLTASLNGIGMGIHNLGLSASLLFVLSVFRQNERWARAVFALFMLALWGGYAGVGLMSGFSAEMIGHPVWQMQYLAVWMYPLWSTVESFRYYAMMRRRRALGLADPLVVNRFFLWGFASLTTAITIWIASIVFAIFDQPALVAQWTPTIRVATAAIGLATISCYALTFFPPERYAAWLREGWVPGLAD